MQTLKARVWIAIDHNKNRFCGFYVGGENKREYAATCAPDSVCTDRNFAYECEVGINADIVSKSETCLVENFKTLFGILTKKNQGLQRICINARTLCCSPFAKFATILIIYLPIPTCITPCAPPWKYISKHSSGYSIYLTSVCTWTL